MTSYSKNPGLSDKVVVTVNGEKEYKSNCRYISGEYYIVDKDCFKIGDKYYRVNTGKIVYCHRKKEWILTTENVVDGVVGFENGDPVLGKFEKDKSDVLMHTRKGTLPAISLDVIPPTYKEAMRDGVFYPITYAAGKGDKFFEELGRPNPNGNLPYNSEDVKAAFDEAKEIYNRVKVKPTAHMQQVAQLLGNRTVGIEYEISKGFIPDSLLYKSGSVLCRDGSTNSGIELVTVPMEGIKLLHFLKNTTTELSKRTEVDTSCSLHIHFGNVCTNNEQRLAMYRLGEQIQDDLFDMFPKYKTDYKLANKRKDYNKKLERIFQLPFEKKGVVSAEECLAIANKKLFYFLSDGCVLDSKFNFNLEKHPIDTKWDRHSRYSWLNLANIINRNRKTVEYRLHHGTVNFQKVFNWLLICEAINKTALHYTNDILYKGKICTMEDVFTIFEKLNNTPYNQFVGDYLRAYYAERKKFFFKCNCGRDYRGNADFENDATFKFEYKEIENLY